MSRSTSTTELRPPRTTGVGDGSPVGATAATSILATAARAGSLANPSAAAGVPTAVAAPDRRGDPNAAERPTATAPRWGMAAVYLMLGYEWLLSALNKDLSGTFRSGLANRLRGSLVDNPHGWYVSFAERVVLPHVGVFAAATMVGEVLVAAGLVWGALLWVRPEWFSVGLRRWLGVAAGAALLGAAVMELNYYLLAGQGWPWLKTRDPFVAGLGVDGLVLLISLALIPVQLVAARPSSAGGPATTGRVATRLPARRGEPSNVRGAGNRPSV
jgi:thiosulfate dehydrogenase (quinone) large subunit